MILMDQIQKDFLVDVQPETIKPVTDNDYLRNIGSAEINFIYYRYHRDIFFKSKPKISNSLNTV